MKRRKLNNKPADAPVDQAQENARRPPPNQKETNITSGHVVLVAQSVVAEMLNVSQRTLEGMRMQGRGPAFVKLSNRCVRYDLEDVRRYIAEHRIDNSGGGEAAAA